QGGYEEDALGQGPRTSPRRQEGEADEDDVPGVRRSRAIRPARARVLGGWLREGHEGEGGRRRRGRPRTRRRRGLRGLQAGPQGVPLGEDQEARLAGVPDGVLTFERLPG